jgi:hypothetical protein
VLYAREAGPSIQATSAWRPLSVSVQWVRGRVRPGCLRAVTWPSASRRLGSAYHWQLGDHARYAGRAAVAI